MGWLVLLLASLCVAHGASYAFGSYYKLFNAQSLWNSRPINPVFAFNVTIPDSIKAYYPTISSGAYSTGVFLAKASDPPGTVYPRQSSINNVDNFAGMPSVTLPHWPADTLPATGSDGHCDIVDEASNILHSFWQLSYNNASKRWVAELYAWAPLNGYGWGDPAHFYIGARAAGVPTSAGLIRSHEVKDGNPIYNHALAMSMAHNGLSNNPTYIYPATSADSDASTANSGKVPEGALMMLPPDYDTSKIASNDLRKVAETLKVYGAYVVDRNDATPYVIYVENGAPFKMSNVSGWDNVIAAELDRIRHALRMVSSADYFVDGNGERLQPYRNINLLSMRGSSSAWQLPGGSNGDAQVTYDTLSQSLLFTNYNNKSTTYQNWSGNNINKVKWGTLKAGTNYTYFVEATMNASLKIEVRFSANNTVNFSLTLGNGGKTTFVWPEIGGYMVLYANKPPGPPGRVRGFIMETDLTGPVSPATTTTGTPTGTSTSNPSSSTTVNPVASSTTGDAEDNAGAFVAPSLLLLLAMAYFML